jgi:hypothetical protein
MAVDVVTDIVIRRPRLDVSGFAADPDRACDWYANIKEVRWETPRPLVIGSRVTFIAEFLGRRLEYTYEVIGHSPGRTLVMRTAQGPFPMETSYRWDDVPDGTRMTLRNRGVPAGFSALFVPFMAAAMRRANRKDLLRLKSILER